MRKLYLFFAGLVLVSNVRSQITTPVSLTSGTYTQDFNTLSNSGTTNTTTPIGWGFAESGSSANTTYAAGTGSENSGNTYSYGASGNTERAFGGLQSGSVIPTIGAAFTNNTGLAITSITITYAGEQWRLGATGRADRLDFQYSTNATALTNGTWVDVDNLDFSSVSTTTVGPLDGNVNKTNLSNTITGLNIPVGATFFIRWTDFNATSSDDGLAVDDFQLSFSGSAVVNTVSIASGVNATEPSTNGSFTVTLNNPAPAGGVTVSYTRNGTATFGSDYTDPQNGTIIIPEGATTGNIAINVVDDNVVEPTETISVTLTSANGGYSIATATASINLLDNESSTVFQANFSTCTSSLSDGFTAQSVVGAEQWSCTTFGRSGNGVQMTGFTTVNNTNEDWLVSPALDLASTSFPILSFYSRTRFSGDPLRLYVTSNYTGDVTTTAWTELNGFFPAANSDVWTFSDNIDLSAFKQANVRFAFRYVSSTTNSPRWTLDDISVVNSLTPPAAVFTIANKLVDFRYVPVSTTSGSKTFRFNLLNLQGNLTLTAPANYELSKDNTTFSSSIVYTPAEAGANPVVYVRLTASASNVVFAGPVQFTATNFDAAPIYLKGNSVDPAMTLNLATWNIRFFGVTGSGSPNPAQQEANAKAIIEALNPDVMAVAEIVDVARFSNLVSSLAGGYSFVLSEHCTGGTTAGACAGQQKVGLIYKTSVMSNVTARAYMISSATARTNFASGRVPLLVSGSVTKNGQTTFMNFLVIHAKANTGDASEQISSYQQRKAGNLELKDSVEAQFANANLVMLGDFNDDLDRTIAPTSGADTVSSYNNFVADSTDAVSYRSVTLPLSNFKTQSTTGFDNMIDHMIVSNEIEPRIVNLSASVYTDIQELTGITDFATSTSDHYPVTAQFRFGGILPVKLKSFTALKKQEKVRLDWITSQEINTREFIVQHSTDGRTFEKVATVAARNANSVDQAYQAVHNNPKSGDNYYRLITVDYDGKTEQSNVLKINFSRGFTVSLSPNPASQFLVVNLTNRTAKVNMQIMDAGGRVVQSLVLANDVNRIALNGLNKGVYLVKLTKDSETYTERLIIQ